MSRRPCPVGRFLREDEHGRLNPFCVLALLGLFPWFALRALFAPIPEDA